MKAAHARSSSNTPPPREPSSRSSQSPVSTRSRQPERPVTRRASSRPEEKELSTGRASQQQQQRSTRTSRTRKRRTNELDEHHVTRDSMVDSLLLSFNHMPGGQGQSYPAHPKQPPLYSSFQNGEFVLDSPSFVYDAGRYMRPRSPSTSTSSFEEYKEDDVFAPRYTSHHKSSAGRHSIDTTRSTSSSQSPEIASRQRRNTSNRSLRQSQQAYTPKQRTSRSQEKQSDMGISERWHSRRSRSDSVVLSSYRAEGPGRRPGTSNTIGVSSSPPQISRYRSDHTDVNYETAITSADTSARNSAMTSQRQSVDSSIPNENFKPQVSSRDKVATITGTTSVLAGNPARRPQPRLERQPSDALTPSETTTTTSTSDKTRSALTADSGPLKERPSFFRRMFGSSKSIHSPERQQLSGSLASAQTEQMNRARGGAGKQYSSQMIYMPRASSDRIRPAAQSGFAGPILPTSIARPPMPEDDGPRPSLNKKASFFRRRRKANPERESLPVVSDVSPQLPPDAPVMKTSSSDNSVSSLRKAMDPLLAAAEATQFQSGGDTDAMSDFALSSAPVTPCKQRGFVIDSESASPAPGYRHPSSFSMADAGLVATPRSTYDLPQPVSRKISSTSSELPKMPAGPDAETPPIITARLTQPFASADPFSLPDRIGSASSGLEEQSTFRSPPSAIPDAIRTRPSLTGRIWLQPSQESVHIEPPQPKPNSIATSQYYTPPSHHESPAESDQYASTRQTSSGHHDDHLEVGTHLTALPTISTQNASSVRSRSIHSVDTGNLDQDVSVAIIGGPDELSEQRRKTFLASFDLMNMNILQALRYLCGRLALRGETQQLDRILTAFSQRWCDCNPSHGFKSLDVVHTICYALFMLNTDQHVLESDQKMTRSQFVKNTLDSVRYSVKAAGMDPDATLRPNRADRGSIPWLDRDPSPHSGDRPSLDQRHSEGQLPKRPRPLSTATSMIMQSPAVTDGRSFETLALVNTPFEGSVRGWEVQVEGVLKDFYNSIRQQKLPLHNAPALTPVDQSMPPPSTAPNSMLRRTGSVMSKAVSERGTGRMADFRSWQAKSKSKPKLTSISNVNSARTSIEDGSIWSPSASSTWSRPYGLKGASASSDTLATNVTSADRSYHQSQSIGFANVLGQAHVSEKSGASIAPTDEIVPEDFALLEDESLALAGAPWAKEGILHHKHHFDSQDKKSKKGNWTECFAVIEKGQMRLFSFNSKASMRTQKNKTIHGGTVVGGGNWTESAEDLGSFALRQTLANTLPPPGYDKGRPFVFALTMPDGAVHLFQVGTPEIALEFVSTANYWSARLSKEPLVGSVSNIEYGWSDAIIALPPSQSSPPSSFPRPSTAAAGSPSSNTTALDVPAASPTRRSFDTATRSRTSNAAPQTTTDRITLADWSPPTHSRAPSTLSETAQLLALRRYIDAIKAELSAHNDLRGPMARAYGTRAAGGGGAGGAGSGGSGGAANRARAMANWEAKSRYLLSEIVKFSTYVESLEVAGEAKERVERERGEYEREIADVRGRAGGMGAESGSGNEVVEAGVEADHAAAAAAGDGVGLGLGL